MSHVEQVNYGLADGLYKSRAAYEAALQEAERLDARDDCLAVCVLVFIGVVFVLACVNLLAAGLLVGAVLVVALIVSMVRDLARELLAAPADFVASIKSLSMPFRIAGGVIVALLVVSTTIQILN